MRRASAAASCLLLLLICASVAVGYVAAKRGEEARHKTAEAVAAEARAHEAERKAREQEENARRQTARADEAAERATRAERAASDQTRIAEDKTKLADAEALRADEQARRAEAENRRASEQEATAHKSLARMYDTRAQAEINLNPTRALAWTDRAIREVPRDDENSSAYMVRALNSALRAPLSVMNFPYGTSPISFSPSGNIVLTASDTGHLGVWDARAGAPLPDPYPSPTSDDKPGVAQHSRPNWRVAFDLVSPAFSQDGRRAAVLTARWETDEKKRELHVHVWEVRTGLATCDVRLDTQFKAGQQIKSIIFGPGGEQIIAFTQNPSTMLVWDVTSGGRLNYETPVHESAYLRQKESLSVSSNPERRWFIDIREDERVTVPQWPSSVPSLPPPDSTTPPAPSPIPTLPPPPSSPAPPASTTPPALPPATNPTPTPTSPPLWDSASSPWNAFQPPSQLGKTEVVEVRDLITGKVRAELPLGSAWDDEKALAAEFNADAGKVFVLSLSFNLREYRLRVWDAEKGGAVRTLTLPIMNHGLWDIRQVGVMASPDEERLLISMPMFNYWQKLIMLWDISGEKPVQVFNSAESKDWSADLERAYFAGDGEYLIAVSREHESRQEVSVRGSRSLRLMFKPLTVQGWAKLANVSPLTDTASVVYQDGTLQTWDLNGDGSTHTAAVEVTQGERSAAKRISALTPDGNSLLNVGQQEPLQFWDTRTGGRKWPSDVPYQYIPREVKFSPDGTRFVVLPTYAVGSQHSFKLEDAALRVRRTGDGSMEPGFKPLEGYFATVEFSRDGAELVTLRDGENGDSIIERRSTTTGEVLPGRSLEVRYKDVGNVGFTRFGEYCMTKVFGEAPEITLWGTGPTLRPLVKLRFGNQGTAQMATALLEQARELHPSGTDVAAVLDSGAVVLIAASPSGARLINEQRKVQIMPPPESGVDLSKIIYSPDGSLVAAPYALNEESLMRVWDSATGMPLSERLWHDGKIEDFAFTADGTRLMTVSEYGVLRSWFFGDFKGGPPEWMTHLGEALGGLRVTDGMEAQRVPLAEHVKLRRKIFDALRAAADSGDERARVLLYRQQP